MRTRRGWVAAVGLLIGTAGCGSHGAPAEPAEAHGSKDEASKDDAAKGEAHVTVRVEPARRSTIAETVEGLGRCEALPAKLATLTPAVEGHVHRLLAQQGDALKAGQPIVELDQTVARADLAEKTAARDALKAALALLKSVPRPEERRPGELAIEQAKVAVARAKAVADRLRPLLAQHEASEQQIFEADQALIQARLLQQTAEATLHALMIGPRPEAVAEAEAKITNADGAVSFSQAHLDLHTIRAPIEGVLDSLNCHPGQTIAIGAAIGEVVDTRQVFATVWLASRSIPLVRVGQAARIKPSDSSAAADAETIAGKVAFVGRVADVQTGNLPVRLLVENPQGRLTLGQTVSVSLVVDEQKALVVPSAAILDQGEGPILSVVRAGKTAVLHPEVGTAHDGQVAVSKTDLKEGEPVIVEGGYNLPEGTPVKVAPTKGETQAEKGP